ncbi:hypothetical protein LINGRAHAP2_LOCUS3954, partial [Linum grandiflorum]
RSTLILFLFDFTMLPFLLQLCNLVTFLFLLDHRPPITRRRSPFLSRSSASRSDVPPPKFSSAASPFAGIDEGESD